MGKIITIVLILIVALVCFVIAISQFIQKGFLFNNTYDENKSISKKPYYIQSGIIFLLISLSFISDALYFIFENNYFLIAFITFIVSVILFAIISTVFISNKYNK